MELDINRIQHQYIKRLVIFTLFLYKRQTRDPNIFKISVYTYIKKGLKLDIELYIELDKDDIKEHRKKILLNILDDIKTPLNIHIKFKTPLKNVEMIIDLNNKNMYENFLYN